MGRISTPAARERHEERGEPLVLRHVGVGAGDGQAPVGEAGTGRPHLLTVQDPLVAVPHGPGRQRRRGRDPADGSLNSWQPSSSIRISGRRSAAACSGVPHVAMVGAMRPIEVGGSSPALRDGEASLLAVVRPQVAGRQAPPAERLRPVDHGVAGVELAALPGPRRLEPRRAPPPRSGRGRRRPSPDPSPHSASTSAPSVRRRHLEAEVVALRARSGPPCGSDRDRAELVGISHSWEVAGVA